MTQPTELNDPFLIKFLLSDNGKMAFLSSDTIHDYIDEIRNIKESTSDDQLEAEGFNCIFNPALIKSIDILDFWERLLIDAIKYLKWHDLNEFPPQNNGSDLRKPTDTVAREKAYEKISEGSLGVYNLKAYFKEFMKFERLLYGAKEFYRDHVYHVIKVWLIGQYILKTYIKDDFLIEIIEDGLKDKDELKEELASSELSKSSKNKSTLHDGEEDAIWCLIALTHDLGYPLGKIDEINSSIRQMMGYFAKTRMEEFSFSFPQQNQFINEAIIDYMSSRIVSTKKSCFSTHLQAKYFLKFSQSFERFDHGIISCLVLSRNLVYFLETNYDYEVASSLYREEARQFVIRREILRAIASHTCPEIYHLKPNTFSFLLLLADELQFFGRPTFEHLTFGTDQACRVFLKKFSADEVSFEIICEQQPGRKQSSLCNFFKDKAESFKKILRVAVKSDDRNFTLKFKVKDEAGYTYEFIAQPRDRAKMYVNNNEKDIKHRDLQKLGPVLQDLKQFNKQTELLEKFGLEKKLPT